MWKIMIYKILKGMLKYEMPQYFAVIKPEAIEELKQAMEHFASRL
jgi:hypothetical protein